MEFRLLFFIESRFVAESRFIPPPGDRVTSSLYFCSSCGETYAKIPAIDQSGHTRPWQSYRSLCRKCSPSQHSLYEWPGSIWRSWDYPFLEALPLPVLQWEFDRHVDSYLRFGDTA